MPENIENAVNQTKRTAALETPDFFGHSIRIDRGRYIIGGREAAGFTAFLDGNRKGAVVYRDPCYAAADAGAKAYQDFMSTQEEGMIKIELEDPYIKELELLAFRDGITVEEFAGKALKDAVESQMSKRERKSLHKRLAADAPEMEAA